MRCSDKTVFDQSERAQGAIYIIMHHNKAKVDKNRDFQFSKGLAKLGNVVADANVSQFSRTGNICCGNKFCCSETKNVFA